jgi:hypothetical protein
MPCRKPDVGGESIASAPRALAAATVSAAVTSVNDRVSGHFGGGVDALGRCDVGEESPVGRLGQSDVGREYRVGGVQRGRGGLRAAATVSAAARPSTTA